MTPEEWKNKCSHVTNEMLEHVKPFSTPISKVIEDDYGMHLGSSSFLTDGGFIYLITNEHVARKMKSLPLAHQFYGSDSVTMVLNPFAEKKKPIDVAISKISDDAWAACEHSAQAIPLERFSSKHQPVDGELLFLIGYSQERSKFHFGTLFSPGTPYCTQIADFPTDAGDINTHFAIHYRPALAESVDGSTSGLPKPPGLSGSLVWNTRFVEISEKGEQWSPENACVTGIVWFWPEPSLCLLATKVEYMMLDELLINAQSVA